MLLAIDIGNTQIAFGAFRGVELAYEFRLKAEAGRTCDDYAALLWALLTRRGPQERAFSSCIISSVVPQLTPDILSLVNREFSLEGHIVGPGIKTGIAVKTMEPSAVGADRIVNAVAVKALYGAPAIVVDFGTATSFDVVGPDGSYEGGVIAPGPNAALEGLVRSTAKLPRIELSWPKTIVGKNTVAAMQSGAVVGYTCLVDGLIDKITAEIGPVANVVATGTLAELFAQHSTKITCCDAQLTLHGLRIIAELNAL